MVVVLLVLLLSRSLVFAGHRFLSNCSAHHPPPHHPPAASTLLLLRLLLGHFLVAAWTSGCGGLLGSRLNMHTKPRRG